LQNDGAADSAKTVLVLGDSHAQQWLPAIDAAGAQNGWRVYAMLKGGCRTSTFARNLSADCDSFNAAIRDHVKANPPDAIITVATATAPSSPNEVLAPDFEATARSWTEQGIDVVGIRDNPRFSFNMAECVVIRGRDSPDCRPSQESLLAPQSPFAALEGRVPGLSFVDMTDLICDGATCPGLVGNTFVYLDHNHLSRSYVASMSSVFQERLLTATGWAS
jgi:hypothetical protein